MLVYTIHPQSRCFDIYHTAVPRDGRMSFICHCKWAPTIVLFGLWSRRCKLRVTYSTQTLRVRPHGKGKDPVITLALCPWPSLQGSACRYQLDVKDRYIDSQSNSQLRGLDESNDCCHCEQRENVLRSLASQSNSSIKYPACLSRVNGKRNKEMTTCD